MGFFVFFFWRSNWKGGVTIKRNGERAVGVESRGDGDHNLRTGL